MGGQSNFGPINPEVNEPWFHSEWERRTFALTLAMGMTGSWNIDISRHARERLSAMQYWSSSYYEIWLAGLVTLLREGELVSDQEMATGKSVSPVKPVRKIATFANIQAILAKGGPSNRPSDQLAKFKTGDAVRTCNINIETHTRLPRYARDKLGHIEALRGTHVFPDSSSQRKGDDPQWLYTVRFTAKELWGFDTTDCVMIDLWEPYLEAA